MKGSRSPFWILLVWTCVAGCADEAEPRYADCVKLDSSGNTVAAWKACEDAVKADPNSKLGRAADEKLKSMKPKYEAFQKEEAERRAAKERAEAEERLRNAALSCKSKCESDNRACEAACYSSENVDCPWNCIRKSNACNAACRAGGK